MAYPFIPEETPIGPLYNLGLSATSVVTPTVISASPTDPDHDGKYDSLTFSVNTTIAVEGDYRLEGWLESNDGALIAWNTSAPAHLFPGLQTLSLAFPGQAINAFRANGPYKLVALKVLQGPYTVIDEVAIAYQTPAYVFDNFEGNSGGNFALLDSGDPNNWNMNATSWSLTPFAARSPLYSWTDSLSGEYGSGETTLTSKAIAILDRLLHHATTITFNRISEIVKKSRHQKNCL